MSGRHDHVFLGRGHETNERAVWAVIVLTTVMMIVEIIGGWLFGSLALMADGFHMSTHAGALLLAALAYSFARRRARDPAFTFGAGKFGDLAGFSSALILAMIALGIAYEAVWRFVEPTPIDFAQAIPIAALGLLVNLVSAWLLSRGGHHHHNHHHHHGDAHAHEHAEAVTLAVGGRAYRLSIEEEDDEARFRLAPIQLRGEGGETVSLTTVRSLSARQRFRMIDLGAYFQSFETIPEPHSFDVELSVDGLSATCRFDEPEHDHDHDQPVHRDHNMRAALLHVVADAAVSVIVIAGLFLAKTFGWLWMDPLAGLVGAAVIASWSYQLIRDAGAVLLDKNPDPRLTEKLREAFEREGDELADLHLWRLGPGHLGCILSIETDSPRDLAVYRDLARSLGGFSHLTIEVISRRAVKRDS